MSKYKFIHEDKPFYSDGSIEKVEVEIEAVSLEDILAAFANYLRACGFDIKYDHSFEQINEDMIVFDNKKELEEYVEDEIRMREKYGDEEEIYAVKADDTKSGAV